MAWIKLLAMAQALKLWLSIAEIPHSALQHQEGKEQATHLQDDDRIPRQGAVFEAWTGFPLQFALSDSGCQDPNASGLECMPVLRCLLLDEPRETRTQRLQTVSM